LEKREKRNKKNREAGWEVSAWASELLKKELGGVRNGKIDIKKSRWAKSQHRGRPI